MKKNKLKIITIILAIVLLTLVSFTGVYVRVLNRMERAEKDYTYSKDVNGERKIELVVNGGSDQVVKDAQGKVVDDAESLTDDEINQKGYTKEDVLKNPPEVLTKENYQLSKEVIEDRLKRMNIEEYTVRLDEETGKITVELYENKDTDEIVGSIAEICEFQVIDEETEEVLMDNNDIKEAKVVYGSSSQTISNEMNVYLSIQFNKEGSKKLENISSTYTSSTTNETTDENVTDESSENKEKKVEMTIDGKSLISTSFDRVIRNGLIQLTYGEASKNVNEVNKNIEEANKVATILNYKKLPIEYEVDGNKYVLAQTTKDDLRIFEIAVATVAVLALIILVIRYKSNGLFAAISYVGFASLFLLLIRYVGIMLSFEGILAILIILILDYIFTDRILKILKEKENNIKKTLKEAYKKYTLIILPIAIMTIPFCFVVWMPIMSFALVMFWGLSLIAIYNFLITGYLLKLKNEKEEIKVEEKKEPKKDSKKGKNKKSKKEPKKDSKKDSKKENNKKQKKATSKEKNKKAKTGGTKNAKKDNK